MSVSVSMPQLGESVTEGTVTRWLKKEGERVEADEPLLEVSTDKVDTEIPSPASGILRGIVVDEDETVAVGAELAVIEDAETGAGPASAPAEPAPAAAAAAPVAGADAAFGNGGTPGWRNGETAEHAGGGQAAETAAPPVPSWDPFRSGASASPAPPSYDTPPSYEAAPSYEIPPSYETSPSYEAPAAQAAAPAAEAAPAAPVASEPYAAPAPASSSAGATAAEPYPAPVPLPSGTDGPYVTPLVRKLAAEHAVHLESVTGTGVGGRIRKQDVLEAARAQRAAEAAARSEPSFADAAAAAPSQAGSAGAGTAGQPAPQAPAAAAPAPRPVIVPSSLRGTTQRMSRPRRVIAQRMVESLQTSAQLTTVVEADVTAIARLRDRAKADFEAREGVKLTFLPFFALAAVEALKVHPKLNSVIDLENSQIIYHDAEHLGVAVDTERGLMVPVIHNAGDLNIGGLARKIGDLAKRTRAGQVGPDELAGGTFTITNTGSRGALFDTPIINQPQVAILGTGTVVKRPVVVEDPSLGEVIAVRSTVYLALTYDHRLVDGADAARFLGTVKNRLEEGAFEAELGL
jgi:2-oxoglutarate dehydrogenase E2 component (dihydrolipoamide succinyltransferase)